MEVGHQHEQERIIGSETRIHPNKPKQFQINAHLPGKDNYIQ